jgi:hypothetical protein
MARTRAAHALSAVEFPLLAPNGVSVTAGSAK